MESTGLRENGGLFEVKIRLSHAPGEYETVSVNWQLQGVTAEEGTDYVGFWSDGFYTQEWQDGYDAGWWVEEGQYELHWAENWVNYPQWIDTVYDEYGELVEGGYYQDNWVDEGNEQEVWVVTGGYWESNWIEGQWNEVYNSPGYYLSGTVTFGGGETEKTLQLYVADDGHAEGDETLNVVLTDAVGAEIVDWSHGTVTILDNAAPIARDDEYEITLPVGTTDGTFDLGSFLPNLENDVDYDGDDITLYSSDNPGTAYVQAGQTLEYGYMIADGKGGYAAATVRIHVVAVAQPNNAPSFTPGGDVLASAGQGLVVLPWAKDMQSGDPGSGQTVWFELIVDDPAEAALFEEQPVVEPDGTLWFTTTGVAGTAHVRARLRDSGSSDFGADMSQEFTFTITLFEPANSGGGGEGASDPALPTVSFDESSRYVEVSEGSTAGKASFVITLSEAVDHEVAVAWQTVAGTGYAGINFLPVGGIAVFEPGQTSYVVEVPIIDDSLDYGYNAGFYVALTGVIGGLLDSDVVAQGTIIENDVTVSIFDVLGTEGPPDSEGNPAEMVFLVMLSHAVDHDVYVDYGTLGLTATAGEDFQSAYGTLVFAAGETVKEIRIALVNDDANSPDPNNPDVRIGELSEQFIVALSSSDSSVTIERPYAVGTIVDDDWKQYTVVDTTLYYYTQWYAAYEYAPGTIIDLDPNCQHLNGGLTQFQVPDNWGGEYFWMSAGEPVYGWSPTMPWETSQPWLTVESLDGDPAGEGSTARFRITLYGSQSDQPVTVYYATHGLTAQSDVDFESQSGSYSFYGDGSFDVDVALLGDALTEGVERLMLYVTSIVGMPLASSMMAVGQVAQPTVKSVKFLTSQENSATTGELTYDNTQLGVLNYRFFPDARYDGTTVESEGRNVVRVRAVVEGLKEGDRVYFRAYDVDDASRADAADNAVPQGNDNYGRLNLELDAEGGIVSGHHTPGDPDDVGGFAGLLRGVGADGLAHVWHGYEGDPLTDVPLVSGIVRRDWITGEYYAEADLLVSFQPGDNFRVVAIPQPKGGEPNWDADDGQIPTDIVEAFETLDFADAAHGAQPQTGGAKASGTLTVWRYLHMEVDQMSPTSTSGEALGDTAGAVIVENLGMMGSHGWRFSLTVDPNSTVLFNENSLEGGIFRVGGENFTILQSSAKGADGRVTITVERLIGRNLTAAQFQAGSAVTVYEDDFIRPSNNANGTPVLQVDMSTDHLADATKYLQSSFRVDQNRLAEAFIMPRYDVFAEQSGELAARNHWVGGGTENWEDDDGVTLGGATEAFNSGAILRSNVFWTSYLGLAYQFEEHRDFDADVILNGGLNGLGDEQFAGRSLLGITNDGAVSFRNSFVFLENVRDSFEAHSQLGADDPNGSYVKAEATLLSRAVTQEIARQFRLLYNTGSVPSILTADLHRVTEAQFQFSDDELAWLRSKTIRPGETPVV
ncbi:MAG: Calx-beta domain-containing protein [Pirellulales bacterium]